MDECRIRACGTFVETTIVASFLSASFFLATRQYWAVVRFNEQQAAVPPAGIRQSFPQVITFKMGTKICFLSSKSSTRFCFCRSQNKETGGKATIYQRAVLFSFFILPCSTRFEYQPRLRANSFALETIIYPIVFRELLMEFFFPGKFFCALLLNGAGVIGHDSAWYGQVKGRTM